MRRCGNKARGGHRNLYGHSAHRAFASRPRLKNGDAKIIKNAGGTISHPFGSVVRSLLMAVYELGVNEIMVVGHTDCGVQHMSSKKMIADMKARGIPEERIELAGDFGIYLNRWHNRGACHQIHHISVNGNVPRHQRMAGKQAQALFTDSHTS